jgi:hypothetical protein
LDQDPNNKDAAKPEVVAAAETPFIPAEPAAGSLAFDPVEEPAAEAVAAFRTVEEVRAVPVESGDSAPVSPAPMAEPAPTVETSSDPWVGGVVYSEEAPAPSSLETSVTAESIAPAPESAATPLPADYHAASTPEGTFPVPNPQATEQALGADRQETVPPASERRSESAPAGPNWMLAFVCAWAGATALNEAWIVAVKLGIKAQLFSNPTFLGYALLGLGLLAFGIEALRWGTRRAGSALAAVSIPTLLTLAGVIALVFFSRDEGRKI